MGGNDETILDPKIYNLKEKRSTKAHYKNKIMRSTVIMLHLVRKKKFELEKKLANIHWEFV